MKTIVVFGKTIKAANDKLKEIRDEMRFGDIHRAGMSGFQYKVEMRNGDIYIAAEAGRHTITNWDYAYIAENIPDYLVKECVQSGKSPYFFPDSPSGIRFEYFSSGGESQWAGREAQREAGYYYLNSEAEPVLSVDKPPFMEYIVGNCFTTKEAAEMWGLKETLRRRMQRFSDENGGTNIRWTGKKQLKHYIVYNHDFGEFLVLMGGDTQSDSVYFASEDVAQQALEIFKEDLRVAWGTER